MTFNKILNILLHYSKRASATGFFLFLGLISLSVNAQIVGTIGMGDVNGLPSAQSTNSQFITAAALRDSLSNYLQKTRKVTVLDYTSLKQRLAKRRMSLGGFYDKTYKNSKLLQTGLDYIVTADLIDYKVSRGQNDGEFGTGKLVMDFHFLGVADATADFSFRASASSSVNKRNGGSLLDSDISQAALEKISDVFVRKAMAVLHPIRVMKIDENSVVSLNYNTDILKAGDTLLVYPKNTRLSLDESGQPLGKSVATLRVLNTEGRFAKATIISGFEYIDRRQKALLLVSDQ